MKNENDHFHGNEREFSGNGELLDAEKVKTHLPYRRGGFETRPYTNGD